MKGKSKAMIMEILLMAVSLAIVLGLVLLLLAELYCCLLRRRRQPNLPTSATAQPQQLRPDHPAGRHPLGSLYAQGVLLQAPRSILFPAGISNVEADMAKTCGGGGASSCNDGACGGVEHFVYICNPVYDNEAGRPSK